MLILSRKRRNIFMIMGTEEKRKRAEHDSRKQCKRCTFCILLVGGPTPNPL